MNLLMYAVEQKWSEGAQGAVLRYLAQFECSNEDQREAVAQECQKNIDKARDAEAIEQQVVIYDSDAWNSTGRLIAVETGEKPEQRQLKMLI